MEIYYTKAKDISMKVIFDADSLIYASCYKPREDRDGPDDKFITDVDYAFRRFKDKFENCLEDLVKVVDFTEVVLCSGSTNNFRTKVTKEYKANRTSERPVVLKPLHDMVKFMFESVHGDGVETDDIVATLWRQEVEENGVDSVVIMSLDKDYLQFPCWYYNYSKRELHKITEEEANHNFYSQMIIGDVADNVNYCKGYGKAYATKLFKTSVNEYSMRRRTYSLYKQIFNDDAKDKFLEAEMLLRLRTDCESNIVKL